MPMLDLLGHPTWYTVQGAGEETVLLLHGGLSNSDVLLDGIGVPLGAQWRIAAFDRRGHGRTADTADAFHYESMVDETIAFIEHLGGPVHIVGWSDGGIVGLLLALRRPDLVGRLVAIGANYHWDYESPELRMDDPAMAEMQARMTSNYVERSPDGADHLATVVAKSLHLFGSEPELTPADLGTVSVPVLLMVGDDDVVPLSHTAAFYAGLPHAQLAIVPGASHMLPLEHPQEVAGLVERFLRSTVPPPTMMPGARR